jgi:sensor c-di-GMP phosphodiesterase-like protein
MFTETEIRSALENDEFCLEYLPVISLDDERCVGGEALIRWRRGDRIVPPMEFIPLVEGTVLSGLITYWIIDLVAEELGDWLRQTENVYIAINVPPEVWGRGGFEYAARKVGLYDLAQKFVLEVTERGLPDQIGVEDINSHGGTDVLIALDDVIKREARSCTGQRFCARLGSHRRYPRAGGGRRSSRYRVRNIDRCVGRGRLCGR